ncbi:MAG: F0F1 ATP synthase subunit B [Firmicutes bacterium]|nr:F0F1 ATP synthase subunit B [Bacillota bacterium]
MTYQELVSFDKWTFIVQILNLFIQIWLFKRFLFEPVKKVMAKRQEEVGRMYDDAETAKADAEASRKYYNETIKTVRLEAEQITERAVSNARFKEQEIVRNAQAQAVKIKEKAEEDIALERKKVMDQARGEISDMAIEIASKLVERNINADDQQALIEQFMTDYEEEL